MQLIAATASGGGNYYIDYDAEGLAVSPMASGMLGPLNGSIIFQAEEWLNRTYMEIANIVYDEVVNNPLVTLLCFLSLMFTVIGITKLLLTGIVLIMVSSVFTPILFISALVEQRKNE